MKQTSKTKAKPADDVRCGECGEKVESKDHLDDCLECVRLVDACNSCIEDHIAEEHPDEVDEE